MKASYAKVRSRLLSTVKRENILVKLMLMVKRKAGAPYAAIITIYIKEPSNQTGLREFAK